MTDRVGRSRALRTSPQPAEAPPSRRHSTWRWWVVVAAGLSAGTAWEARGDNREVPTVGYAVINGEKRPVPGIPMGDPQTVARIVALGTSDNRVMEHLGYLCEEIGARLTGSTAQERAAQWVRDQFEDWGLANAHLWQWGEIPVRFDRGPSSGKVLVADPPRRRPGEEPHEESPEPRFRPVRDLEFTTLAWTAGTNGPVRGHVVRLPLTDEEYHAVKDRLRGAWVLVPRTAERLGVEGRRGGGAALRARAFREARQKVAEGTDPAELPVQQRIIFDGIAGLVSASRDDLVRTSGAPGWRELDPANIPPDIEVIIRGSDYDFINSRLADGEPVALEFNLPHTFTPGPIPVHNVIADIPGTEWPDEFVIVSAHLDSWNGPGSQGCTDNGTGSAVTMEAARLLMAANARPKRTIRFILWTGEEQGLLGSRAYVEAHRQTLDKISAVFVDDGGTNYEGGLRCLDSQIEFLAAATAPVNGVFYSETDGRYLDVNVQIARRMGGGIAGGSSDHASFLRVGVPGFFWDEVGRANYGFGWHTQNDRITLAIPEYLVQSATCSAVTAYNLACAPALLPRHPLTPDPEPAGESPPAPPSDRPAEPTGEASPLPAASPPTP